MPLSLIGSLLGWTKLPQWALELIALAALALGLWFWHHEAIEKGIADQVQADTVAAAKLKAATDAQTATLQARATMAEQAYDTEHNADTAYRVAHPLESVRLCIADNRSSGVPQAGAPKPGNASPGASTASLQPMPTRDSGSREGTAGPDISRMLEALGAAADTVSAQLREFQAR